MLRKLEPAELAVTAAWCFNLLAVIIISVLLWRLGKAEMRIVALEGENAIMAANLARPGLGYPDSPRRIHPETTKAESHFRAGE